MKRPANNDADRYLQAVLATLRAYGLDAAVMAETRFHTNEIVAVICAKTDGRKSRWAVDVKLRFTAAALAQAIERKNRQEREVMFITDYIPRPAAERLRQNDIAFVDLAGNAYVRAPHTMIWVEGRKAEPVRGKTPTARAYHPGGIAVTFSLLANTDWVVLPTRTLAQRVGLANGTVAATLVDLEAQGFVIRPTPKGRRQLRNTRVLLDRWTEGYLQRFQHKLYFGIYRHDGPPDWWKRVDWKRDQAYLGGEPAAAILTKYLTPGEVTVYADKTPARLIAEQKLHRDPGAGRVIIRKKFWHFDAEGLPEKERLVPPLLVYADLMGTGDARCIEAAGRIRETHLARLLDG